MILTQTIYEQVTGDSTGWAASAASAAQDRLEDALGRRGLLESQERSEQCRFEPDGTIYPGAVPITAVDGGLAFFDDIVYGSTPDASVFTGFFPPVNPPVVTLTYTGGFTTATCPGYMLEDLAWATYSVLHPELGLVSASVPAGATAASSGDVSVSSSTGLGVGSVASSRFRWSFETMRHKRRSP